MLPWHYQSLSGLGRRIRSGAISALQVTEYMLERISRLEPELHSYARVLDDQARATAARLDLERSSGKPSGALHGIPIAVKDLLDMQGVITASGTRVMAHHVPVQDAAVIARLKQAGAVIIGKTQLTEGAFAVHHPDVVAPVNPWNPRHWTGVSSSGSGVAVAARLAFAALGTDTGGSIRFPSASCGLVGIKPTYGRVSRRGAFPLGESLDHIGPMARTVEDAARVLGVIAGHDAADATSLAEPVPDYLAILADGVDGLCIGVDWQYVSSGVEAAVVDAVRAALTVFAELGARVVELTMPASLEVLVRGWQVTCGVECARAHALYYPVYKAAYGPVLAGLIERGLRTAPADYEALERVRVLFRRELDERLQRVDLIIAPCMPMLPPELASMEAASGAGQGRAEAITFTAPFDYSGHPTITLPVGLAAQRLPLAIQLIGRRLDESTLIRAGAAFEQRVPFSEHPLP
jgi:amidase